MNQPSTLIDDEPEIEEEMAYAEWNFEDDEDKEENEQEIVGQESSAGTFYHDLNTLQVLLLL